MLQLKNIYKSYTKDNKAVQVLNDFSLSVKTGEFIAVQGPSGCGKTTMLLTAGGLMQPEKGQVLIREKDFYAMNPDKRAVYRANHVGFVFQQYHLIPYLTVLENVLTLNLADSKKITREKGIELLEYLGLQDRINHVPGELSVGEKQRTALARALLNQPEILFADEITGNLDDDNTALVIHYLQEYKKKGGTILLVTHDSQTAGKADRIVYLK
ncbi:ABC transporter ATP-binding protein [candidate division KSB1 bacterium]|nr:ABC transporter ATP-binding protein [candidate division KSB1 bacterium]